MKVVYTLLSTTLFATSVFAAAPATETAQVVRALVNNPDIVSKLKDNNSPNLIDSKIETVKDGILQYTLTFNRQCECMPSTAVVNITEDFNSALADGPITYKSSIVINPGK